MNSTYIIGEIGQNHNGSVEIAKKIIDLAGRPVHEDLFDLALKRADAVKLTKRDLEYELSTSEMNRPYRSKNSFGKTYGEHRRALELSDEQHFELFKYAREKQLDFIETLCAPSCLSLLKFFQPDRLKVASRDLTNLPLLKALAETKIPLIISTGMADKDDLNKALDVISVYHDDISILHCVSEYPTHPRHVNLNSIKYLKSKFPQFKIGYSDHTIGISVPVAAVALGAEIIEKHITIDRTMKGTDQAGSLGEDGLRRMVRDIRLMEMSMGQEDFFMESAVKEVKEKLERSIAAKKKLSAGHVISEDDIHLLSPGTGISWTERELILGKTLKKDLDKNELIIPDMVD